ncbi:zinc ribbon domain-containing protein [Methylomonas sp. SURF-1]|uniref:Zinc ribbon domain-containing protein n=1 Tax=Methylomonas aurea TaxID=2952224 RepID=A0ABT1UHT4_9GAMM|nr:zinc ribbon domain-containing protein [Methylomonas sp. SURF-1]MCQ8181779.1 zinc ribbon domain-containing protein [Methylomonas sp. SURF-1]
MSANTTALRAAQLLVTLLTILAIGKAVSLVPMMDQLELFWHFKAGQIVWFAAKLAALVLFYFCASLALQTVPDRGGVLAFAMSVAEPLCALAILAMAQSLFWEILEPFVNATGKTIYYGSVLALIVGVSVWLVLRAYRQADQLVLALSDLARLRPWLAGADKRRCRQCRSAVSATARFCAHCGGQLQPAAQCHACGSPLGAEQRYCPDCGADVQLAAAREAAADAASGESAP